MAAVSAHEYVLRESFNRHHHLTGLISTRVTKSGLSCHGITVLILEASMDANMPKVPDPLNGVERRSLPRKRVLLSGVIANIDGEYSLDCVIRDINVRGAKIELSETLRINGRLYLLDVHNQVAHLATTAWSASRLHGLAFVRSYALAAALSPDLRFLGKLLLEAKLRHVQSLIKRTYPLEQAIGIVGLTTDILERFGELADVDAKSMLLLHQVRESLSK